MWIKTSNEVYAVIFARHRTELKVHGTLTDSTGNGYEFSTGRPEMITEWGFEHAENPLISHRSTKQNESQKEWDNEFYIYS